MFGADTLFKRTDSRDRRPKPELTSRLSKKLEVKTEEKFIC